LRVEHPAELLLLFGNPGTVLAVLTTLPPWFWPLVLLGIHFVMVFRGILFHELVSGAGRARAWPR
jgi:hypothetical protein